MSFFHSLSLYIAAFKIFFSTNIFYPESPSDCDKSIQIDPCIKYYMFHSFVKNSNSANCDGSFNFNFGGLVSIIYSVAAISNS